MPFSTHTCLKPASQWKHRLWVTRGQQQGLGRPAGPRLALVPALHLMVLPWRDSAEAPCPPVPGVQEKLGVMNKGAVYALWDYEAQHSDELSFHEGDTISILRRADESETEWWWARLGEREGYVPKNLLGVSTPSALCTAGWELVILVTARGQACWEPVCKPRAAARGCLSTCLGPASGRACAFLEFSAARRVFGRSGNTAACRWPAVMAASAQGLSRGATLVLLGHSTQPCSVHLLGRGGRCACCPWPKACSSASQLYPRIKPRQRTLA